MFRQLCIHTPAPLTPDGQCIADQAAETFIISLTPAGRGGDEASSLVASGTALRSEVFWELCRQCRISAGLIPMTQPPTTISDAALGVENCASTATATLPSSLTPLLTSPLESQCGPPFQPMAWRDLTSVMHRPRCWQLASSTISNKTTKMLLRFCQHMTMERSSPVSSLRGSVFPLPMLLKGWVYEVAEASAEVKAEVADPSRYLNPGTPLTRNKRKLVDQLDDPHCRHRRASSIIEALPSSLSVSKRMAVKHWLVTSGPISTHPICL
jgi:hypothetical protein